MKNGLKDFMGKARLQQAALSSHQPEQYAAGFAEFFGREFACDPRAPIPRFETAYLVKETVRWCTVRNPHRAWNIADIGTGSGVIAISLALHLPHAKILASDISGEALSLAAENAHRHGVFERIQFVQGSLLAPHTQPLDVIAVNLPYLSAKRMAALTPEVRDWEPQEALYGGNDGFDRYRALFKDIRTVSVHSRQMPKFVICEIDDNQGEVAKQEIAKRFPEAACAIVRDVNGLIRYAEIEF